MKKQATWGVIEDGIKKHLDTVRKTASLSTTQGVSESKDVATPSSDPEVKDILPNGGNAGTAKPDLYLERGVESGVKLPGQADPSPEEKERKETSPDAKLAAFAVTQNRLADTLVKAAALLKAATEPGGTPPGFSAPGIPKTDSGGKKDDGLGHGEEVDKSGKTPTTESTQTVVQTEPGAPERGKVVQGTKEESVKIAELDVNALGQKVAQYVQHYNLGAQIGQKLASMLAPQAPVINPDFAQAAHQAVQAKVAEWKQAGYSEEQIAVGIQKLAEIDAHQHNVAQFVNQKVAEWRSQGYSEDQIAQGIEAIAQQDAENLKRAEFEQHKIASSVSYELANIGIQSGVLSQAQAEALLKTAGVIQDEPIIGEAIRQKVASCRESGMNDEQILNYLRKAAAHDAAAMGMQGQGAPSPEEIQQALHQLVLELHQAVQAGQMSEEQALDLLRQEGLPVDEMLQGAASGGADGGAAADVAGAMGAAAPEAAAADGSKEHESKETPAQEKKEDDKKEEGKKEASGEIPGGAGIVAGDSVSQDPSGAGGAAPDPSAGGADPALQQILSDLQALVAAGKVSAEEAQQIVAALSQGGGGAGDQGAPPTAAPAAVDPTAQPPV